MSCDVLPTEAPGPHIQGDVLPILGDGWDLIEQLRAELLAANDELRLTALAIYGEDHDAHELHVGAGELRRRSLSETRKRQAADRVLSEIAAWSVVFGAELRPPGADSYGEGVRNMKDQVCSILRRNLNLGAYLPVQS